MKLNLLLGGLLLFLAPFAKAQTASTVDYADFEFEDINLESTQTLAEVTIEPETSGYAIVRMEGISDSDPGDRIVFAVNNQPAWEVNHGNSGTHAFDENHRVNNMIHTRVFYVEPGLNTFYAVAHNYVFTDGSGIADLKGRLTVTFFANGEAMVYNTSISSTFIDLEVPTQVAGYQNLDDFVPGKWFYRLDALVYADYGKTVQFSIGNEQTISTNESEHLLVNSPSDETRIHNISLANVYEQTEQTEPLSVMAQVFAEEGLNHEASIYGTFSAFFLSDDWVTSHTQYSAELNGEEVQELGEMTIAVPEEGYIVTHCTGWSDMTPGSVLDMGLSIDSEEITSDSITYLSAVQEGVNYDGFGLTKLIPALDGTHTIKLHSLSHADATLAPEGSVHGFMYAYFIPDDEALNIAEMKVESLAGYPNPTSDYFQIQALNDSYIGGVWKLYDLNGKLALSGSITSTNLTIDLNDLANGIWVLQTVSEDQSMMGVGRIVKR